MSEPTQAAVEVLAPSKPRLWHILGPGLITGAADDDPSGVATYAQAGAQFGFSLGWTLLLTYPLMVVIQTISARIGRTTGLGIAGNLRQQYPNWVVQWIVILVFAANVLNIGADLGAMAEASALLVPCSDWTYVVFFGVVCSAGQALLRHTSYVSTLKWLTVPLLAYFGTVSAVEIHWGQLLQGLLVPAFRVDRDFWLTLVAILGTNISPYLFFWQAAQEVEDTKAQPLHEPLLKQPSQGVAALRRIRLDTWFGMGFSNLVALAILVTAGATLHESGITQIDTAAQAAQLLRPLAGDAAFALFTLGIVGTGLLSVPVLAGSAAYALAEARQWRVGLSRTPGPGKAFYVAIAAAALLGMVENSLHIRPLKALVWVAMLNGIVAVPVMVLLMLMSANRAVMGEFQIGGLLRLIGWIATGVMAVASAALLASPLLR
jgi:NRAMP (natural resistance-associated macrophage protein)-like metal ion transporter